MFSPFYYPPPTDFWGFTLPFTCPHTMTFFLATLFGLVNNLCIFPFLHLLPRLEPFYFTCTTHLGSEVLTKFGNQGRLPFCCLSHWNSTTVPPTMVRLLDLPCFCFPLHVRRHGISGHAKGTHLYRNRHCSPLLGVFPFAPAAVFTRRQFHG